LLRVEFRLQGNKERPQRGRELRPSRFGAARGETARIDNPPRRPTFLFSGLLSSDLNPVAVFHRGNAMNYAAFTNDSLTMMYEGIRGALAADDALKRQGMEIRFRVRETPEWKLHAAELETEMLGRGMMFEVIDWSEDR
jgi:hypothetical protein